MSNKKLIVGIPGWKLGENSYGCTVTHLEFIQNYVGNVRIIMPWEELATDIDMLYLPGGADLFPLTYGRVPGFKTGNPDLFKQFFYESRLKGYIDAGVPIFAVCLGFQQLCAYFGSTLKQDLLRHPQSDNRGEEAHGVNFTSEANAIYIHRPAKNEKYMVNSHHHQGVPMRDLPEQIIPLAYYGTKDKGVLEAMIHKTLPIAATQWHPEEFFDDFGISLFQFIAEKAIKRRNERNNSVSDTNSTLSV